MTGVFKREEKLAEWMRHRNQNLRTYIPHTHRCSVRGRRWHSDPIPTYTFLPLGMAHIIGAHTSRHFGFELIK